MVDLGPTWADDRAMRGALIDPQFIGVDDALIDDDLEWINGQLALVNLRAVRETPIRADPRLLETYWR